MVPGERWGVTREFIVATSMSLSTLGRHRYGSNREKWTLITDTGARHVHQAFSGTEGRDPMPGAREVSRRSECRGVI